VGLEEIKITQVTQTSRLVYLVVLIPEFPTHFKKAVLKLVD